MAKAKGKKSVDERLAEFERELKRLDRLVEEKSGDIRDDFRDFEKSFRTFLAEENIDLDDLKGKIEKEMTRLRDELDFTAKTLKESFDYFRERYQGRKKD